jgi:hypothetical protein
MVGPAAITERRASAMSIKGFHYFFVTVSMAMSLFVFAWAARRGLGGEGWGSWVLAAVCLAAAIVLGVYGVRVRRKLEFVGEPRPHPRLVE